MQERSKRSLGYFYNMMLLYTSYEADLVQAVQEHPDYDLIFTGHSLGAAAASLAAVDFLHRLRPQLRSELRGAPLRGEPLHGLPVLHGRKTLKERAPQVREA